MVPNQGFRVGGGKNFPVPGVQEVDCRASNVWPGIGPGHYPNSVSNVVLTPLSMYVHIVVYVPCQLPLTLH